MMIPNWAKNILAGLFSLESFVAIVGYTIVSSLLVFDVALREIFGFSIFGAQRISVYIMIITGFLGLGLATARGRHLRPRFADALIPERFQALATRLGDLIMALTLLAFAWIGVRFVIEAHEFGDVARIIEIPLWILHLVVPYAFLSTATRHVIYALYPTLKPEEVGTE